MPQTLLAFVSMLLVTVYSLNVQQQYLANQRRDIAREIEEMAGSIAVETMEIIRARAFDQAVVDGTTTGTAADLLLFEYQGSQDHFATGHQCSIFGTGSDTCDDIDDFHKMATATRPYDMGLDTLYFSVDVEVMYVDDNFERFDGQTFNKAVTVTVRDVWPGSTMEPYLAQPVRLSRVFSYTF
ncbi:MAG: hypothetical protein D6746_03645 [Bacteroidetes bacterium]|nr:MAG: hypothetical protein D6746_03645 [Bacteroidota bacterium]